MKYTLIPPEERHKYKCCICGKTESVKYMMPTLIYDAEITTQDTPYCNRCALLFADLERRNSNE